MSSKRRRIFTLNDPYAMRINKELAAEIGFQDSIVLLQIEHLVSITDYEFDGEPWTRATLDELREDQFSWWSNATISRILHRLESRSFIKIANYNKAGYDRTQWFTINTEGIRELDSIAILQPETAEPSHLADCNLQIDKMQDPSLQNETTIPETYEEDLEEELSNESSKKACAAKPSSPSKVKKVSESEAEDLWANLCDNDPLGNELQQMAELLASENKTGEVAITRVWRELGKRYSESRSREELSNEAWRHGFEQALGRGAANIGWVLKAAKGYRGKAPAYSNGHKPPPDSGYERVPSKPLRRVTDEEAGLV